ncbi:hypothetical protein BRD15_03605 [Halobacteriales archaeon SW_6_65_15]|nr:MAG: hypothetical protein BRD15_03605 [Halobacteriales archaeon SW_6_65_15]
MGRSAVHRKWRRQFAVVGILLILAAPPFFWKTCDDRDTSDTTSDGFEIVGFTGFTITYATDDVRVCTVGTGPVLFTVGAGLLGYLLLRKPQDS